MTDDDRIRWDRRYTSAAIDSAETIRLPADFGAFADRFPTAGLALDIACGRGAAALWLSRRGMSVCGYDISPVAIAQAADMAHTHGLTQRCHFAVVDLDAGLPPSGPADVIICNKFRDPRLDEAVIERLAPGGLLAISALADRPGGGSRFGVQPGRLRRVFAALDVIASGDTWLLARKG